MDDFWKRFVEESIRIVVVDRSFAINLTAYEHSPRLLLTAAAIEMALNVCLVAFLPIFCSIVWKSGIVHRNFRLQLCTSAIYYSLGVIGRFYLFYVHYTVPPNEENVAVILIAQFTRTAATVFAETLIGSFALERAVATFFWSWYEKGSRSTILVFVCTESINTSIFIINSIIKYEVSLDYLLVHNLLIAAAGFTIFWLVYRRNVKMFVQIKSGAQVGSYSVARTFQVKENVGVLKYMIWMSHGWICATIMSFTFYGYFSMGPEGYDISRALSYNLYEMSVALHFASFYCLSITGNQHIFKQFRELSVVRTVMGVLGLKDNLPQNSKMVTSSESEHYFTQLHQSWN